MADPEIDTTQQVTSTAPATKVKNPKRVAAGKLIAEKTRQAREEQKRKMAEADSVLANERLRKAQEEAKTAQEVVDPPVEKTVENTATSLTTTQWLSVAGIIVSLVAIYYKREEIKGTLTKIKAPAVKAPTPVVTSAPPVVEKSGIRSMD